MKRLCGSQVGNGIFGKLPHGMRLDSFQSPEDGGTHDETRNSAAVCRRRLPPRGSVHQGQRPGVPHRHPGHRPHRLRSGAARSRHGSQDRRLHLRLSRFAARWRRSRTLAGQGSAEGARHRLHAGSERGSRRHRRARLTTGRNPAGPRGRRRVRALVRQGPRRRSRRRRIQAWQCLWLLAPWRRAGGGGRRSRLRLLLNAASVRCRVHDLLHADPQSGVDIGVSRLRRIRLRAVALFRHVGRLQGDFRNSRSRRLHRTHT